MTFATPVAITAGTVYVASYFAPVGHYAGDGGYFAAAGVDNAPLHALEDGVSGGNGVYVYGGRERVPDQHLQRDQLLGRRRLRQRSGDRPGGADRRVRHAPATRSALVSWTAPSDGGSPITSYTVTPYRREHGSARDHGAAAARRRPRPRSRADQRHGVHVHGHGDQRRRRRTRVGSLESGDTGGDDLYRLHDLALDGDAGDPTIRDSSSVELGVKFKSDVNGSITGIRFYKGAGNTGTHVGHLWIGLGHQLATATFTGETATGWQQVTLRDAGGDHRRHRLRRVVLRPGRALCRRRRRTSPLRGGQRRRCTRCKDGVSGGNGVYAYAGASTFPTNTYNATNYWVDVVLSPARRHRRPRRRRRPRDARLPGTRRRTVTWTAPSDGGSPITSYTVTPFVGATAQPATTVSGSPPATTATITGSDQRHGLHVHGDGDQRRRHRTGVGGLESGRRRRRRRCTACTIWPSTATPATLDVADGSPVELGVKFKSDVNGSITGIRFYKGPATPGPTSGTCGRRPGPSWRRRPSPARAPRGWQQATFATPVADHRGHDLRGVVLRARPGTTRPTGRTSPPAVDNGPLHALAERRQWRQRRVRLRRCEHASRPTPTTRPTTGSTSSSRPVSPRLGGAAGARD